MAIVYKRLARTLEYGVLSLALIPFIPFASTIWIIYVRNVRKKKGKKEKRKQKIQRTDGARKSDLKKKQKKEKPSCVCGSVVACCESALWCDVLYQKYFIFLINTKRCARRETSSAAAVAMNGKKAREFTAKA